MPRRTTRALLASALVVLAEGAACTHPQPAPTPSPVASMPAPLVASAPASSEAPSTSPDAAAPPAVHAVRDASTPEYYLELLRDPALRPMAVRRLTQFYEDAMTRADKSREDPKVKALCDQLVPALTRLYVDATDTDKQTEREIIRLLADARDLRAKPAWIKALASYQPTASTTAIGLIARAIGEAGARDPDLADALIATFVRFEAGSKAGAATYMNVKDAMTAISSPRWEPVLIARLARPMNMLTEKDRTDQKAIASYRNEQFWQVTAAEVLGNVRSKAAVRPLLMAVMDPDKADVAPTAVMSLVKIGPDSMPTLVGALQGTDSALLHVAKPRGASPKDARAAVVRSAALVIGTLGRRDGATALLQALGRPGHDDVTRAVLARELAKCPSSTASLQAILGAYESLSPSVLVPPGMPAKTVLVESLAELYDASVVPRMIRHADSMPEGEDRDMVRDATVATLLKVMRRDQLSLVESTIQRWAPQQPEMALEKAAFAHAKGVVLACRENVACYLDRVASAEAQQRENQFIGIKSAYMIGALGTDRTRAEIVKRLPAVTNAAVLFSLSRALDHLCPDGDPATARALESFLADIQRSGDGSRGSAAAVLRQVMVRMRARQP